MDEDGGRGWLGVSRAAAAQFVAGALEGGERGGRRAVRGVVAAGRHVQGDGGLRGDRGGGGGEQAG